MRNSALVWLAAGLVAAPAIAQTPKYGVTVVTDKKADFAKFKSYTWEHGWQAPDKAVHANIVEAIDRELKAVGLEKKASGGDVIVTYGSLRRIDVDLNSKPTEGEAGRRQYDVGSLVVLLLEPGTRKELFRGRVDQPIELEPEKVRPVIDTAMTEMFAKYPTRKR